MIVVNVLNKHLVVPDKFAIFIDDDDDDDDDDEMYVLYSAGSGSYLEVYHDRDANGA